MRLRALLILQHDVAQPEQRWIFCDPVLNPPLVQFAVCLQRDPCYRYRDGGLKDVLGLALAAVTIDQCAAFRVAQTAIQCRRGMMWDQDLGRDRFVCTRPAEFASDGASGGRLDQRT